MKNSKLLAMLCWLVAASCILFSKQFLWVGLAVAALGVFLWLATGTFNQVPEAPVRADGRRIEAEEIKEYRQAHPETSISQAISALKKEF